MPPLSAQCWTDLIKFKQLTPRPLKEASLDTSMGEHLTSLALALSQQLTMSSVGVKVMSWSTNCPNWVVK